MRPGVIVLAWLGPLFVQGCWDPGDVKDARCGDGDCDAGEDHLSCPADCSCPPDCSGRECGPDPRCGESCGTCDDSNQCTADSCNGDGRCEFEPTEGNDFVRCDGALWLDYCSEGSVESYSCAQSCGEIDSNGVLGCNGGTGLCDCIQVEDQCVVGHRICGTLPDETLVLASCRDDLVLDESLWFVSPCATVCAELDFSGATGECGTGEDGQAICYCYE